MRAEIESKFRANLARVRQLVETYEGLAGGGAGRSSVAHTDILRAAVVLLHASMEDLIRSVSEWKLPTAPAGAFREMAFPNGTAARTSLEELAQYRGQAVNDLFAAAIRQGLDRSTYNNTREVGGALARVAIEPTLIMDKFGPKIESITTRRHLIVHRVDWNPATGSGHHSGRSLRASTVMAWITGIEDFAVAVLNAC